MATGPTRTGVPGRQVPAWVRRVASRGWEGALALVALAIGITILAHATAAVGAASADVRHASSRAPLPPDDRALLRAVFGIDDPARLYVRDDEATPALRYSALPLQCAEADTIGHADGRPCRPISVRVGLTAPREPGESWDAFVTRVEHDGPHAWPNGAREYYTSLASLDPDARPRFERLVADARRAGFRVRVAETYRSPDRQALLLARGDGRTATATSVHSYGRAVDLVVRDGNLRRPSTVRAWIAFRRWVVRYRGGMFRLVGTPEDTWDWPHVELAAPPLGFASVDALLEAARACAAATTSDEEAAERCTLAPHLPPHVVARDASGAVDQRAPRSASAIARSASGAMTR